MLAQAAGLALLARTPSDGNFLIDVLPGFVLVGIGAPLAFVPLTAAPRAATPQEAGLGSGLFNTAQQLGNAFGLAGTATLAAGRSAAATASGRPDALALTDGYRAGFLLAVAILLVGAAGAARLRPTGVDG